MAEAGTRGEPAYRSDMYRCQHRETLFFFLRHYPFATLVPAGSPEGDLAFVPLLLDESDPHSPHLVGHLDNANPFLRHLHGRPLLAVFAGPNGYISPSDYVTQQLPTWNYSVVQVRGPARCITDEAEKLALMLWSIAWLERDQQPRFELDVNDRAIHALIERITFFRLDVQSARGIFKFSQDKSAADRAAAGESLLRKLHATQSAVVPRLIDAVVV